MNRPFRFTDSLSGLLSPVRRKARFEALMVLAVFLSGAAAGCSVWKTVPLIPETGGRPAQMRLKGSLKISGSVKIILPDSRELEGRWEEVGPSSDLESRRVTTPGGDVSAADLAGHERPSLVVDLWGHGLRMICACTGDDQSGYNGTCIDSEGTRWTSSHRF